MTAYSNYNDEELLLFLKGGDKVAYAEIYKRYWPLLFRHARRLLQSDEQSKDVVQDAFVNLWTIAPSLDEHTLLSPYLYASTRNTILNIFRRNKIRNEHLERLSTIQTEGTNITDHVVREKLLAKLIEDEISRLPSRMREVFELKRKANLSYKEIAETMNISELTVKTQMNKAITALRKKFGENLNVFFPFL